MRRQTSTTRRAKKAVRQPPWWRTLGPRLVDFAVTVGHASGPHLHRVVVLASSVALLGTSGCKDLDGRSKYLTGPEVFQWTSHQFSVREQDDMWGAVNLSRGSLSIFVREFPPGTELEVVAESATVSDEGYAAIKDVSILHLLGPIPLDTIGEAELNGLTFTVTPPGLDSVRVPIPPIRVLFVDELILANIDGPLPFEGDPSESPGPPRNAVWFHNFGHSMFGKPAPVLSDVDAFVKLERTGTRTKICSGYKDDQGRSAPDVTLKLQDTVVTVHARRSGSTFAAKTFPPVEECPRYVVGRTGDTSKEPTEAIEAWLATAIPKP